METVIVEFEFCNFCKMQNRKLNFAKLDFCKTGIWKTETVIVEFENPKTVICANWNLENGNCNCRIL